MTPKEAKKAVEKYSNISEAARALKVPRSTLSKWVGKAPKTKLRVQKAGMSRDEFMKEFDPITKARVAIQEAVEEYLEDDRYVKENEMKKLAGITDPKLWRAVADDPEDGFCKYQFEYGGFRWWTTPKSRNEMVESNHKARAVE